MSGFGCSIKRFDRCAHIVDRPFASCMRGIVVDLVIRPSMSDSRETESDVGRLLESTAAFDRVFRESRSILEEGRQVAVDEAEVLVCKGILRVRRHTFGAASHFIQEFIETLFDFARDVAAHDTTHSIEAMT